MNELCPGPKGRGIFLLHPSFVAMDKNALLAAAERIRPFVHYTPVLQSTLINQMCDCDIFFKCENFQRMGAFKMRGASNAILQLSEADQAKGVVTHSSGNFAQAVALASKMLDIKAHIVMPTNAPAVKKEAVRAYGGIIYECEPTQAAREAEAERLVKAYGCTFLHPYDMAAVIQGQATATMELLDAHANLDVIVAPVGGGGLISGAALAAHYFSPHTSTIAAEPLGADDTYKSITTGELVANEQVNTIADGLRTNLGIMNFQILKEHLTHVIRVEDKETIAAMKLIWERMKLIVEPSSAVALAAVMNEPEYFKEKRVGVILSGGNVDLSALPFRA